MAATPAGVRSLSMLRTPASVKKSRFWRSRWFSNTRAMATLFCSAMASSSLSAQKW